MAGCLSRKKVVPISPGRRYNEGRNRSVSDSCRYANGVSVGYGVRGSLTYDVSLFFIVPVYKGRYAVYLLK